LHAACGCVPTTGTAGRSASADATAQLAIIDAHTHTDFDGTLERTSKIPVTKEQYLKEWQKSGVVGAVSHTSVTGEGYVEELRAKNVIFCAGIGPNVDAVALEGGLKSGKFGCIKVYLGYVHR